MAQTDEPRPPSTPGIAAPADGASAAARSEAPTPTAPSTRAGGWRAALLLLAALAVCVLAYLALAVPEAWFPGGAPKAWTVENLALTRGTGALAEGELVITAPDATGMTLVSVVTRFRSSDYPAVAWAAIGIPESAEVRLLWSTDYAPQTLNSIPVQIEAGRPLPVLPAQDRGWIGNVTGLALAIQGPLPQPLRIRGVVAKPMGAVEILGDRAREWLALEGWTGTSINTVAGGADVQALPLPLLLGIAVALASATGYLLQRFSPRTLPLPIATMIVAWFVAASFVLDARWAWNLARQLQATASQFAGLSIRDRYLAGDDGPLYAFIEKARALLPAAPARVFVLADAAYFRDRAAYHLYPHNVYFDPLSNAIPPASTMRTGDWLVVYQRRGIQYNPSEERLRWNGGQNVAAELKLRDGLGALFLVE